MNSTKYLLTDRQREIVDLRLQGLSTRKIAEQLAITNTTVEKYIQQAYKKLGVHNMDELHSKMLELEANA